MSKEMVISVNPHETRVAILEEGQLCEYYVEREREFALVGSIYKGRVTRVLPGMQSAFVEIGLDSDAFLYVSDFMEEVDDLDTVVTTAEDKIKKIEDQGGRVFPEAQPAAAPVMEPADVEPVSAAEESAATPQASAGSIEPLPGEKLSPAAPGESRPAPPPSFGGRGRDDRGGRGHFGGRGGRDRGRGGRFGRRGRGGDRGERRPHGGRDLPASKYASPSYSQPAHDEQPSEPMPEGYTPIILPGESLAKYRERPALSTTPDSPTSSAEHEPISTAGDVLDAVREDIAAAPHHEHHGNEHEAPAFPREQSHQTNEAPEESHGAPHVEARTEARMDAPYASRSARSSFASPASSSAFEPLPGESISKFRRQEAAPAHTESHPVQEIHQSDEEHDEVDPDVIPPPEALDVDSDDAYPKASPTREALDVDSDDAEYEEKHPNEFPGAASKPASFAADVHEPEDLTSNDHVVAENSADQVAAHAHHLAEMIEQSGEADEVSEEEEDGDELIAFAEAELDNSHDHGEPAEVEEGAEAGSAEEDEDDTESGVRESLLAFDTADEPEGISAEGANGNAADPSSQGDQQPWKATVRGDSRARMQHPNRRGGRDRGGRRNDRGRRPRPGQHGGGHHGRPQQRRPQLISELLKQGQEIIVQIAKEPLGKKGARITSHVALPGRYLVYMPTLHHTGVSRKIASAEERSRLRHLVNEAKGTAGGGFIVRTAASSAPPEDVRADVEFLTRTWSEIKTRSEQRKAPSLLHRDLNLVERILRDFVNSDFGAVWVDSEEEYTKVVDFMSRFQPALVGRVKLYTKDTPIYEEFGIQQEIDKGLRPKVWLKSGGYIVINHTEALVAIDVNTGKFVGKGSNRLEDTIVRTNLEAVKEIVRQMRLRDLGGIIVIDFIDMEERRNREKVMAALEDALRADRAPSKVLRFNEFGLVAITRKRTKQALERTLCQPCPYCAGSGMVKSIPTLCYEIQAEAKKMAPEMDSGSITLRVNPEISKALKTRESSLIEELERWTKKSVIIQGDPALHWEQYDIY